VTLSHEPGDVNVFVSARIATSSRAPLTRGGLLRARPQAARHQKPLVGGDQRPGEGR